MEPCYPSNAYKTYLLYLHSTWVARRPPRGVIAEKVGKQWASGGAGRYRELNSVTIWWEKKCLRCWMDRKFFEFNPRLPIFAINIIQRKHPLKKPPEIYGRQPINICCLQSWWTQNSNQYPNFKYENGEGNSFGVMKLCPGSRLIVSLVLGWYRLGNFKFEFTKLILISAMIFSLNSISHHSTIYVSSLAWNQKKTRTSISTYDTGLSSLGVPGVPAMSPPDFGRSINPISSRWRGGKADYAHQIILTLPDFQTLLRPCDSHLQLLWRVSDK